MCARSERDKPGLIQADVSAVNKPLGTGSSLAASYHVFVSTNCGVLLERESWFGRKLSRVSQSCRNNSYIQWVQSTIPMRRGGHLHYYHYLNGARLNDLSRN